MSRGPAWTESEVERAFSMRAAGMSGREIGVVLNRPGTAVNDKLASMVRGTAPCDAEIRMATKRFALDGARYFGVPL